MLIEFSATNFRSIKTRQTLSLVAGSSNIVRQTKSFKTGLRPAPYLLRAAAIYGANGAGKTSLIKAIAFLQRFIITSSRDREPNTDISGVIPYLFSSSTRDEPSEFEISFITEDKIYQYGFIIDKHRVYKEWLYQTQKGARSVRLIDRSYNSSSKEYEIYVNPSLEGAKSAWKTSTRPDALLFSTAVSLNSSGLKIPYDWISKKLRVIQSDDRVSPSFTTKMCNKNKDERVMKFINDVGLDVVDLYLEEVDVTKQKGFRHLPQEIAEFVLKNSSNKKVEEIHCAHIDEEGEQVLLPFDQESDGTRALVSLAGPWIDTADSGITLFVDELHNSLHPFALKYLIENYFTNAIGNGGGQLIFTTHDIFPMEDVALHRDQIWFVEKPVSGGTQLVPLSDYKVRSGESYKTGYIKGRYGGVPITKSRSVIIPS
ncbi:AAA family ATPase [Methylobacterium gossipiicola]|uniref:AAA+ ATPase domain-containing protein n=1 Tax=Methylobacterium gossipiicola TaxID=582675 RepID=A0A1I2VU59_9HYPH|nr:ATP-binding protein [Methylobacterium gossipiicola]SFG92680.1 hypothetical protein SAMN05192565_11780 [Methylobacterium gossipiicola]